MPSLKGSPPFSWSRDEVIRQLEKLALAVIGVFAAWFGADFLPFLKSHVASDSGNLVIALLAAGIPWVLDSLNKLLGDTTSGKSGLLSLRAKAPLAFAAVGAMLLAGSSATAADIAVIVPSTPGSYLLQIDAAGNAVLSPLGQVVRFNGPPTPPIPPTPPALLTDRAIQIRDAAAKVTGDSDRVTTAHGLAELYRQVAKLIRTPGQVTDLNSLVNAVHTATDTFLASRGQPAATGWQPVRDVFSTQWTAVTAKGGQLGDYATLLDEAASGFDASAPGVNGAGFTIPPQVMDFILKILLPLLLQLLQPKPM